MKSLTDILLPYQQSFFFAPQRRKYLLASRQTGKSLLCSFIAAQKCLQRENGLSLVISTG